MPLHVMILIVVGTLSPDDTAATLGALYDRPCDRPATAEAPASTEHIRSEQATPVPRDLLDRGGR